MEEVKKAVLHLSINAGSGSDAGNRSLTGTWQNYEKRRRVLSCLQDISSSVEESLVLLVDCEEALKNYRDRKRTSYWPIWLRFLQDCYGVHTRCILKKRRPFASLDILLRGVTSEETIDRVCREADALYRLDVHGECSTSLGSNVELSWTELPPVSTERGSIAFSSIDGGSTQPDSATAHILQGRPMVKDVQLDTLPASPDVSTPSLSTSSTPSSFETAVLGGTFDHLHSGHKILLSMSTWLSERRVVCGVTEDALLKHKRFAAMMESLEVRMENVKRFLQTIDSSLEYEIIPIHDVYGPTATDPPHGAIVVSVETQSGANMINEKRKENGIAPLTVFTIGLVAATNSETSSEATSKEITREQRIRDKLGSTFLRECLWKKTHPE